MSSYNNKSTHGLSILDEVFEMASHHNDTGAVTRQLFRLMKKIIPFRRCALYILNEEDEFQLQDADPPGGQGHEWVHQLIEDGVVDWLIREEKVRSIPHPKGRGEDQERLIVPLIVRGKGFGFIAVEGNFGTDVQAGQNSDLLIGLGAEVGVTLENSILAQQVDERHHRLDVLERISQKRGSEVFKMEMD